MTLLGLEGPRDGGAEQSEKCHHGPGDQAVVVRVGLCFSCPVPPDLPEISVSHVNLTVREGDNAVITCNGSGSPLPDVDWIVSGLQSINTHQVGVRASGPIGRLGTHHFLVLISWIMNRSKRCGKEEEEGKSVVLSLQEGTCRLGLQPPATFSSQLALKRAMKPLCTLVSLSVKWVECCRWVSVWMT